MRRLWLSLLAFLTVVLLARLWWGWSAGSELEARLEKLRARGEPVALIELNREPIPDQQNAAWYLFRAADAMSPKILSPASSTLLLPDYPPFPPIWDSMASAAIIADQQTLELAHQARQFDRADFGIRYDEPFDKIFTKLRVNHFRTMANLLGDAALYAHVHGDDAAALERIMDLRHLASSVNQTHLLVSYLTNIGIDALAVERLQVIAPGLRCGLDDVNSDAVRKQMHTLIDQLLHSNHVRDFRDAIMCERLFALSRNDLENAWMLRPLGHRDQIRTLIGADLMCEAIGQPTWPQADRLLAGAPEGGAWPWLIATTSSTTPSSTTPRYSRLYSAPVFNRLTETEFRVEFDRQCAAVSLAMRLYVVDHGTWPDQLAELVPEYLPFLPDDPMAPTKRPLGYAKLTGFVPDGSLRPIIYSVMPDGIDDTAGGGRFSSVPEYFWSNSPQEQWRDLARWSPTTLPSTLPSAK